MRGSITITHGILCPHREIILALLPSLILILSAFASAIVRGRRLRLATLIGTGTAVVVTIALSQQLPSQVNLSLWRPMELFGPSFYFSVDSLVWPYLLLGSVAVLAEALLGKDDLARLIYAGIGLAAIAAGNVLTIAMLWTLMIVVETGLRWTASPRSLWKSGAQFAAVGALLAAANMGESAPVFLAIAAVLRSSGGSGSRFPYSLAVLAPLGAFAAVSRDPTQIPWLAITAIGIGLVQSFFLKARFPTLALALIGVAVLALPTTQGAVLAAGASVLVASATLHHAGFSRYAWGAVAIVPFALLMATSDPWLLVMGLLTTAALAAIARIQPRNSNTLSLAPTEIGSLAIVLVGAVLALVSSGWLPNLWGAIAAGVGLAAGFGISLAYPAIASLEFPKIDPVRHYGLLAVNYAATLVRTTVDVLEGESAVLWILLILLIAIIGLRAVVI